MQTRPDVRAHILIGLLITLAIFAVYGQALRFSFTNLDDNLYITNNANVQAGLSAKGIAWAFTATQASNWHPLTWLSHLLDCQLFGLNPTGHHLTNLLLHIINSLLLMTLLIKLTGSLRRSALVAALFALHPLHVESVAWIAERKDVLSTCFLFITLITYARYVEHTSIKRYLAVALAYGLGLMAKPMLVTLPIMLLLLDYWPLHRAKTNSISEWLRLIREKLPLFGLSAASCLITYFAQHRGGAVVSLTDYNLSIRVANALVAYAVYIKKFFWPMELTAYYPHPGNTIPQWQVISAAIFLLLITAMVLTRARKLPHLAVGWAWYIVTLIPVIGLVQVGNQAMADRYTYIPFIGLFATIVWSIPKPKIKLQRNLFACIITLLMAVLSITAWHQTGYWKNSRTLFEHALTCTSRNYLAHNNLGLALAAENKLDEAMVHYRKALDIVPNYLQAHINLANTLAVRNRFNEAADHYKIALSIDPTDPGANFLLAVILDQNKHASAAVKYYKQALRYKPDLTDAANNLAWILATNPDSTLRNPRQAVQFAEQACRHKSSNMYILDTLAAAYASAGQFSDAIAAAQRALKVANTPEQISSVQARLTLYTSRKPYTADN